MSCTSCYKVFTFQFHGWMMPECFCSVAYFLTYIKVLHNYNIMYICGQSPVVAHTMNPQKSNIP